MLGQFRLNIIIYIFKNFKEVFQQKTFYTIKQI